MIPVERLTNDSVEAFAVFAAHLNFTHAAAELHIAQPSLHTKIRKLSEALDCPLYTRIGRTLRLTPEGRRLQQFATDSHRRADDFLRQLDNQPSRIDLQAGRGMLRWVLGGVILQTVNDGIELNVSEANRTTALQTLEAGRVDVVGIASEPPPSNLESEELTRVPQVVLVPTTHHLAQQETAKLSEVSGEQFVLPPVGRPHRARLEQAFAQQGLPLQSAAEVDGWDLLIHLASLGVGLTIVNGCVPPPASMCAVPLEELPKVGYWLVWRADRPGPAEQLLASRSTAGELS